MLASALIVECTIAPFLTYLTSPPPPLLTIQRRFHIFMEYITAAKLPFYVLLYRLPLPFVFYFFDDSMIYLSKVKS